MATTSTELSTLVLNLLTQEQYNTASKNANELYLISNIDNSEVFIATYGATTFEDITTALTANKICICVNNTNSNNVQYGQLILKEDSAYYFESTTTTSQNLMKVSSDNTWTIENINTDDIYLTKIDPNGTGSLSLNRKSDSTIGTNSVALGINAIASGNSSIAEGEETTASNTGAHAEGYQTTASGTYSHAEGHKTTASGTCSHAEGYNSTASGSHSHAEGYTTSASRPYSHTEGFNTKVTSSTTLTPQITSSTSAGYYGHAEGYGTISHGLASHAEGNGTSATGIASHSEGAGTTASGSYSHASGYYTTALDNQFVIGHYNNTSTGAAATSSGSGTGSVTDQSLFVIGNGTSSSSDNAFRVNQYGKAYCKTSYSSSGADYAEYFEWEDLNLYKEDRRGYFVTLDGEKIKIAEPGDYILGVISALPAIIGNGDEDWMNRYVYDEFGSFVYEEYEYETPIRNNETQEIKMTKQTGIKHKENPDYDPTIQYTPREERPEWDAVGMIGVLAVRDDGTCKVNGYCQVAEGGIATSSKNGYRVIKRINDHVIKIVFK